jgi:hypothetical protein
MTLSVFLFIPCDNVLAAILSPKRLLTDKDYLLDPVSASFSDLTATDGD